jgi:hypothetical protein
VLAERDGRAALDAGQFRQHGKQFRVVAGVAPLVVDTLVVTHISCSGAWLLTMILVPLSMNSISSTLPLRLHSTSMMSASQARSRAASMLFNVLSARSKNSVSLMLHSEI